MSLKASHEQRSGVVDAGNLDVVVAVGLEQPWYQRS
jgi:hypothetical protein